MKKSILAILCSLFCLTTLHARDINFSQISSKNGLSQNTVRAIAEDKNGFIWAGTLDGLNRYDGYNIRSYQLRVGNTNTLNDHRIRNLYPTRNGKLWVQTYQNEFSCYEPTTDSFIHIKDEKGKLLNHEQFYESTAGDIWLWGKTTGAIRLQEKEKEDFDRKIYYQAEDGCNFLLEDSSGKVWIGGKTGLKSITKKGAVEDLYTYKYYFTQAIEIDGAIYFSTMESELLIYDLKKNTFEEITPAFNDPITNIFRLSPKELLVFFDSQGIWVYNVPSNTFHKPELYGNPYFKTDIHPVYDKKNGVWFYNQLGMLWYCNGQDSKIREMRLIPDTVEDAMNQEQSSFTIDAVLADSEGLYWITTYGCGLYCYDPKDDTLTNYTNQPDQNSIASNYLLSITEDRFGNMWVGSEYAGIIQVVKSPEYIRTIHPQTGSIIGKTNNVRSIYEDSKGYMWLGLKNASLYVYNSDMTQKKCIGKDISPYTLIEDKKERMWVGTKGYGIYLYDTNTFQEIRHFKHKADDPTSLGNDVIFHIMKDSKDRIWIASFEGGIYLAQEDGSNITFKSLITNKGNKSMIRYLYQDHKGMIWAGSCDGLIKFNPDELIRNPNAYTFYNMDLSQPHTLSSNDIKTIYQDKNGTLWIGTAGGGLNKYIEATKDTPEHFISFTINEGMPDNYVLGILECGNDLWLSSESGLSRFNKTNHSIVTYQFAQKAYANVFNEGAYLKRKDGTLL